jgi:hypothetical protein
MRAVEYGLGWLTPLGLWSDGRGDCNFSTGESRLSPPRQLLNQLQLDASPRPLEAALPRIHGAEAVRPTLPSNGWQLHPLETMEPQYC